MFSEGLQQKIGSPDGDHPPFVGIMSHGCSGDIWRRDYKKPPEEQDPFRTIEDYTAGLLEIAVKAYRTIEHKPNADLAMSEARPVLKYRVPDRQRLDWAKKIVADLGDQPPMTPEEVYALEQILLHERQTTEIVVQGLRIGDIGIATTPNETYALTGLKVKLQSPLPKTMVIELANGGDGYIPPPEQHVLGGYNTWAARSAGLEVQGGTENHGNGTAAPRRICCEAATSLSAESGQGGHRCCHSQSTDVVANGRNERDARCRLIRQRSRRTLRTSRRLFSGRAGF